MKYKLHHFVLIAYLVCSGCFSPKNTSGTVSELPASSLQPFGRYAWNNDKHLELISSAVHFGFSFNGNQCSVFAYLTDTSAHNYLQYELDGVYQKRIRIEGNNPQPVIISAATG